MSQSHRPSRGLIQEINGEEFGFHATSDTFGAYPYLVDLEEHNGDGECSCPDFEIARRKLRKEGETSFSLITCKHLKRSFLYYGRREVKRKIEAARRANRNKTPLGDTD